MRKSRIVGLLLGGVFGLLACSPGRSEQSADPVSAVRLYEMNCAVCHGMDGKLGNSGALDLTKSELTGREVRQIILEGKNAMPPFLELVAEPASLDSLVNHVLKMRSK